VFTLKLMLPCILFGQGLCFVLKRRNHVTSAIFPCWFEGTCFLWFSGSTVGNMATARCIWALGGESGFCFLEKTGASQYHSPAFGLDGVDQLLVSADQDFPTKPASRFSISLFCFFIADFCSSVKRTKHSIAIFLQKHFFQGRLC